MKIVHQEDVNFLLTNPFPRTMLTRLTGWFSRIERPFVRDASILIWRFFTDLDLSDAKQTRFRSMQDCFTRELKPGSRPVDNDPNVVVSPCDAIIGATGTIQHGQVLQVKGSRYDLAELLGDAEHARTFSEGRFVTLRLTSGMYHRFHAPHDSHIVSVSHFPGDTWNVNPVTLQRVPRVFVRNERAVIRTKLVATGYPLTLVPVAAILVAGIRLPFLDLPSPLRQRQRRTYPCSVSLGKGQEMGWFEHGSTIILLTPEGFTPCGDVHEGGRIRAGQSLLRLPA